MFKKTGILLAALICLGTFALAQNNRIDVEVGAAAAISKQSAGNGTILNPTNGYGFLGQVRYRFSRYVSIEGTYGRTPNSQRFTVGPNVYRIDDKVTEYSGSVLVSPIETAKYEIFVLAGIGGLRFYPSQTSINGFAVTLYPATQTKPAFVYGGGVDYKVFRQHVALRLQYRGLYYRAPDFKFPGFFTGDSGHIAEPSVGLVFKF